MASPASTTRKPDHVSAAVYRAHAEEASGETMAILKRLSSSMHPREAISASNFRELQRAGSLAETADDMYKSAQTQQTLGSTYVAQRHLSDEKKRRLQPEPLRRGKRPVLMELHANVPRTPGHQGSKRMAIGGNATRYTGNLACLRLKPESSGR